MSAEIGPTAAGGDDPASPAGDPLAWHQLGSRTGSCGWITVETRTFEMPDGTEADWDVVDGPDIVACVAVTAEGEVVLVRQFRPGPGLVLRELPGGLVDAGEEPLQAATRELLEETGYAGTAELVGALWRSAAETRRQWVVAVTGCRKVAEPRPEPTEFLAVELVSPEEFLDHVRSGRFTDTGAAYRVLEHLRWLTPTGWERPARPL